MTTTPLLAVEAIEVRYDGAILAVDGVSLQVGQGQVVALLGANGAGKSTTLKALSGLLGAARGSLVRGAIRYEGRDLAGQSADARVRAGLAQVLEGRHCFGRLSVEENLLSGGFVRRLGRAAQREELERIYAWFPRLAGKRRQLAGLTSGGEQQMIALGRALMARPRLLLLDEPSMGLAPLLVEEIFASVARLNREEGLSVLMAEQNSAIALDYAHQAFVLESGRVVQSGVPGTGLTREAVQAAYLGVG
ncbi:MULTISPECIES: ABC transporter ATP-binding protein [Pseudomonas]|uniref:ABC transporter ATP-binding protein n=1 Tax=Pseudomonas TaxID=286 RepID=UPI00030C0857|nr:MULTISPECIES: ABC transporter ATP-binding protein [Pseudomonas]MDC7831408.1 ABC transporter ATP-binding protein [Pseudomonas benzopyrenica]